MFLCQYWLFPNLNIILILIVFFLLKINFYNELKILGKQSGTLLDDFVVFESFGIFIRGDSFRLFWRLYDGLVLDQEILISYPGRILSNVSIQTHAASDHSSSIPSSSYTQNTIDHIISSHSNVYIYQHILWKFLLRI